MTRGGWFALWPFDREIVAPVVAGKTTARNDIRICDSGRPKGVSLSVWKVNHALANERDKHSLSELQWYEHEEQQEEWERRQMKLSSKIPEKCIVKPVSLS